MTPFLTTDELAAAWQVHPESIRRWTRAGCIDGAERCGRRWRYRPDARFAGRDPALAATVPPARVAPVDFRVFRAG